MVPPGQQRSAAVRALGGRGLAASWAARKEPTTNGAGRYQRVAGVERGLAVATNSVASRTPWPNGVGSEIR
jgi:hypothetical protein